MFSHVTVGCSDLVAASRFYDAVLSPLGLARRVVEPDGGPGAACWVQAGWKLPRFYVYRPFDGRPCTPGNGSMVAFAARDAAEVDAAHAAGLLHGGVDEGAPGPRPRYGNDYYGAYLRDPDGNKIHIVFRDDLRVWTKASNRVA
jgi:catechol 2,3-dioxygenase-like lactoylglutathione lyase family enzyme